jgi:uncharacterized oligopeptide transporter (OPT) family protein
MKRRFINDEQQPFPEGRACAVVLDSLYPDAPAGGTRNMVDGNPVPPPPGAKANAGGVDMGVFKAKALFAAAAIGAVLQFLVAGGYQAILQIRLLGTAKATDGLWKIPERLDEWWYHLAAKNQNLWLPRVNGVSFEQLGVTVAFDLAMVGAGGLMGMRIANSLVIGMVLNYLVLAPMMISSGEILPKNMAKIAAADGTYPMADAIFGRAHLTNTWCLWWGVAMMVTASMIGLFAKPKVLFSAFGGLLSGGKKKEDCVKHIELPLWLSFVGVPVFSALIIWLNWHYFGVQWWLSALSIPLIILLTLIAANATALTSTTPTGSLSKITQFTFGSIDPGHAATNLMTAGVTTEVASNASNLLMDIKPGYMLGAKPRQQAWCHCIGIVAGALASTPLFFILFLWKWTPEAGPIQEHVTEQWAVPGAIQWAAISEVIAGMGATRPEGAPLVQVVDGIEKLWGVLPVSAAKAMLVGAIAAAFLEILRITTRNRFPISAVAIGLGVVLPPESTIMMWLGAFLFWFFENRYHQAIGTFGHRLWVDSKEAVAAGLIAGWAIVGIGDGIIGAVMEFPESTAEVEKAEAGTEAGTAETSSASPAK